MSNPYIQQAFDFITHNDLNALPIGKTIIDGDNLWVNIIDAELMSLEDAKFEAHNAYIDIQIPLSGSESFGIKDRSQCTKPMGEFNQTDDYILFNDKIEQVKSIQAGEQILFYPDTAHAPLIGDGHIRKAVFKVRVLD